MMRCGERCGHLGATPWLTHLLKHSPCIWSFRRSTSRFAPFVVSYSQTVNVRFQRLRPIELIVEPLWHRGKAHRQLSYYLLELMSYGTRMARRGWCCCCMVCWSYSHVTFKFWTESSRIWFALGLIQAPRSSLSYRSFWQADKSVIIMMVLRKLREQLAIERLPLFWFGHLGDPTSLTAHQLRLLQNQRHSCGTCRILVSLHQKVVLDL